METNRLPYQDMTRSETGCCPQFDPTPWEGAEIHLRDQMFVRGTTRAFLHVPINISSMMSRTWGPIKAAGADSPDQWAVLSTDPSPWRTEHYFWVDKEVPGLDNVRLSGDFLTKVFEGPFKDARRWVAETRDFVAEQGKELRNLYFYYTTCPKCAKHYGKNYVVAFAQV